MVAPIDGSAIIDFHLIINVSFFACFKMFQTVSSICFLFDLKPAFVVSFIRKIKRVRTFRASSIWRWQSLFGVVDSNGETNQTITGCDCSVIGRWLFTNASEYKYIWRFEFSMSFEFFSAIFFQKWTVNGVLKSKIHSKNNFHFHLNRMCSEKHFF